MLKIALTKGRLEEATVALFEKMGLDVEGIHHKGRRLFPLVLIWNNSSL